MEFLMDRDTHEELLNELLDGEIEQSRRTEILQELRSHHNQTLEGVAELSEKSSKLTKDNDDLIISNSQLFRQLGVVGNDGEETKVDKKEFSETVTIDDIT